MAGGESQTPVSLSDRELQMASLRPLLVCQTENCKLSISDPC